MWNAARGQLEDYARVIAVDQRGLGESALDGTAVPGQSSSPAPAPNVDVIAEDVIALLDELGLPEVVLGGCSMGGYAAMAVLRRVPERVSGLLLVDTRADADTAEGAAARLAMADRAQADGIDGWLAENSVPKMLGHTTRSGRPELVERVREWIDSQPPQGIAWAQRAMARRPDSFDALAEWDGPALVAVGDEDEVTTVEMARDMVRALPRGELTTIPRAGHFSPIEQPDAFAHAVSSWLTRTPV